MIRSKLDDIMSESQLQAAVIEAAQLGGWLFYHTYDSRQNSAGFPDLILVRGDTILAWELKTMKGRTTVEQTEWMNRLSKVEYIECGVIRPCDLDSVNSRLTRREDSAAKEPPEPLD